ncbi:hypothetical protein PL11_001865 [Lentilactobacillus curieae]|uniref:Uncharacterized protein n=1 Tax=Lentilactobacillus curieae TaxID=1138822 RepID=A0A1S6QGL3_9LACO|nr:hypothetical protein [Lentilactobacillus curieae]AQW20748.1 hypothetical protein PL11_001865 [Lentilactobacillus curieae]
MKKIWISTATLLGTFELVLLGQPSTTAEAKVVALPAAYRHIWTLPSRHMMIKTYKYHAYFTDTYRNGHKNDWIKYRYVKNGAHKYGTFAVNGIYESVGLYFKNSNNLYLGYDTSTLHFRHK